jgi:nucleoside-diphosphate-sugar epimerase
VTSEQAAGRNYNVAESEALSFKEWTEYVVRAAGWQGDIVIAPKDRLSVKADYTQHWVVDTARIRQELGYTEIISREEALRRTVAWQIAHPIKDYAPEDFDYATEDAILAELGRGGK